MIFRELKSKIEFWRNADRLGPDILWTHWKLHLKSKMRGLCSNKFKYFGEGAEFRPGAYAVTCSKISLGRNVIIRPTCMLFADPRDGNNGSIIIEDDVMLGSGVHIYVANHRFDNISIPLIKQGHYPPKTVILRKGCWIGANSIILPGVEVGENAVVGAGSLVTKSIPTRTVYAGNPAKFIKDMNIHE